MLAMNKVCLSREKRDSDRKLLRVELRDNQDEAGLAFAASLRDVTNVNVREELSLCKNNDRRLAVVPTDRRRLLQEDVQLVFELLP